MFEKILISLDGSKLAEQILPYATEQALRFSSRVVLLQAFIIPSSLAVAGAEAAPAISPDLLAEEARRLEAETMTYLEEVAAPLREKSLDVDCVTLQGLASEVIIGYAQRENVALIALATHGHSSLSRVIFGSVADHVLRESGLPVLIIKPQ